MIKLVLTDMDGTFLDSQMEYDNFLNWMHKLYEGVLLEYRVINLK